MPILKKIVGSGFSALQSVNVVGDVDPAVTALGNSAATAYLLGAANTLVTTTAASTGVILPPGTTGAPNFTALFDEYTIANKGVSTLTVYPPTGGTIDGSASASVTTGTLKYFTCVSTDGLTWYSK